MSLSLLVTAPIPEDPSGYHDEGYGNYGQGGGPWQNNGTTWPDGGAYDAGYVQGEDQWGQQPGPQTEAWDTGQYPPQAWDPPHTSPVHAPSGPAAFAEWGHLQGPPNAPPPPHAPQQPPGAPPPATQPSRPGANGGVSGWKDWGAEAMAYSKHYPPPPPPPPPPPGHGPAYGQPNRVAFANQHSYAQFGDRAQDTPQAQRMMFDSIMNSRGGPPQQPQQRSTRGPARGPDSTHTTKQPRKSKKEKRVQEQNAPNGWGGQQENPAWQDNSGWEQDNSGWKQDNQQWDQGGYGWDQGGGNGKEKQGGYEWDQGGGDWKEKQEPAFDTWPPGAPGRDDLDSQGYTDSEGWNDVTGRKNFRRTVSNAFVPAPTGESPYPMPSRTMAYANETAQDPLDAYYPGYSRKRNTMHDYANIELLESYGEAFKNVENAFFGRDRKARERIHWQFPHDKDERVRHALEWLHDNAHGVGAFGVSLSSLRFFLCSQRP